MKIVKLPCLLFLFACFSVLSFAQKPSETPPPPGKPPTVRIPVVKQAKLGNNLPVVVVERKNVPLVTVKLLTKAGANRESAEMAGLADMTGELLTKGTKTRTATQIAQEIEFLGGSLNSGADWNSTEVTLNILSDKIEPAFAIMADAVLNPTFLDEEINLYKTQTLDNLSVSLKQPGTLGSYVASRYSFGEHSAVGTPETIDRITQKEIANYHDNFYTPENSVLIFTGDISAEAAMKLAEKYFGSWKSNQKVDFTDKKQKSSNSLSTVVTISRTAVDEMRRNAGLDENIINKILVVDLPNSGQSSVSYAKKQGFGRVDEENYYASNVLNSILGGGYSSRLNQEIRIKRGLSYGARSGFSYRPGDTNFIATTQTKDVSAAEVAELIKTEIQKLSDEDISAQELQPRKLVLTGSFGRNLETNGGLANLLSDLYLFGLSTNELNNYMQNVETISEKQIRSFAAENLKGGDIIIVGDYAKFKDDLKKRFPNKEIEVISTDDLDLNQSDLRKVGDSMK